MRVVPLLGEGGRREERQLLLEPLQLRPTLCEPTKLHQAPVPGNLQARTLEWAATAFSGRKLEEEEKGGTVG